MHTVGDTHPSRAGRHKAETIGKRGLGCCGEPICDRLLSEAETSSALTVLAEPVSRGKSPTLRAAAHKLGSNQDVRRGCDQPRPRRDDERAVRSRSHTRHG